MAESQVPEAILLLLADLSTSTEQSCDATGQEQGASESVQLWSTSREQFHLELQHNVPTLCGLQIAVTSKQLTMQLHSSKTKPQKLVYNHEIGVFPSFRKLC